MIAVTVGECVQCGQRRFPLPIWCHRCGSFDVRDVPVSSGTVAEATIVRRAVGVARGSVRLGAVALDGGGVVVARLEPGVTTGMHVAVGIASGAVTARVS